MLRRQLLHDPDGAGLCERDVQRVFSQPGGVSERQMLCQ
jgi:hypothetical protein